MYTPSLFSPPYATKYSRSVVERVGVVELVSEDLAASPELADAKEPEKPEIIRTRNNLEEIRNTRYRAPRGNAIIEVRLYCDVIL